MPVYRTPDGRIVEEKTGKADAGSAGSTDDLPTDILSDHDDEDATAIADSGQHYDRSTRRIDQRYDGTTVPISDLDEDPETQLMGPRGKRKSKKESNDSRPGQADAMNDPVVGWLVVTNGPGKGNALRLGYGANQIGRSREMRIQLDFGDKKISRDVHSVVTYDPRGQKFYLQNGTGKNLTYFEGSPVLQPVELPANSDISIGETILRFVPLCGPDFDWKEDE